MSKKQTSKSNDSRNAGTIHRYGYIRDLNSQKDYAYEPRNARSPLPVKVDHTPSLPPVRDQGNLGSCTGHGVGLALMYDEICQKENYVELSPLMLYYTGREMEGNIGYDSGCQIRDVIEGAHKIGACPEAEWPYDIAKFQDKPEPKCYKDAKKSIKYMRVSRSPLQFKQVLAEGGIVVIGFTVYQSFESQEVADTGDMPMPARHEEVLGGHCVGVVGYDDARQVFICRNSWGPSWGDKGNFYMPYKYITNTGLSGDFWTIQSIQ